MDRAVIIRLTPTSEPQIVDRDRVDRLHATATGPLGDMVLAPTCRPADDEHVWVAIDALRAACGPEVGAEAFDATIDFATGKGWLDTDGSHVCAHVEHADD